MAINFQDLARMYSTTTGDSDIYLNNGAVPGCKTFAEAGIADSDDINFGVITYNTETHRPYATQVGTGHVLVDSDNVYRIQRTTTLSAINSSDSAELDTNITLSGISEVYIPWLKKDVLRVKEADGSPNVFPVNTIVVSNGTLTADSTEGQVTITTGGGGGGSISFAIFESTTIPTDTGLADGLNQIPCFIESELVDAAGLAHLDSDPGYILIDTAGTYQIEAQFEFQGNGGNFGNGTIGIYIDSDTAQTPNTYRPYLLFPTAAGSAINDIYLTVTGIIKMTSGDFLWAEVYNDCGATIDISFNYIKLVKIA